MDTTRLIAELTRHRDAILAHLGATRALLTLPPERARLDLARRRWELVRLLRAYQLFKHGELFDPVIRRRDAGTPIAQDMKMRCLAMGDAFAAHTRLWASDDTPTAWRAYVRAETVMIDRLRSHLLRERDEARRLLATTTVTRAA